MVKLAKDADMERELIILKMEIFTKEPGCLMYQVDMESTDFRWVESTLVSFSMVYLMVQEYIRQQTHFPLAMHSKMIRRHSHVIYKQRLHSRLPLTNPDKDRH